MSLSCRYAIARPPRPIIVPTMPNTIAIVSVPLLEDRSELDWLVPSAEGRRAVVFSEGHVEVGILLAMKYRN